MNVIKHHKKMIKYLDLANDCTSRKEAQKIIHKYETDRAKVLVCRMIENNY